MYLLSLFVSLDVDLEVNPLDRERLLQAIRQKLKQKFQNKLSIQVDSSNMSIFIAFLEENFGKAQIKLSHIGDFIDSCGEARIRTSKEQVFSWFDDRFKESSGMVQKMNDYYSNHNNNGSQDLHTFGRNSFQKTIVYTDRDEDDESVKVSPIFTRKNLRIPTRK